MTGTAAGARPKTHRVLPGDSLWSISEQHGVSIGALRRANAMPSDDDHIAAGERVVVPNYAARHVAVREGDTVAALARAFATTPEEIARHNPDAVVGGDALRAGAELYLPRRDLATGLRQLRAPRSMLEPARDADRTTFWGMFTHTRDVEYYRSCARTRPLLDALRMVETSNIMPAPVGDGGASIGPLQISKEYHADAWEVARMTGEAAPRYDAVEEIPHAEETALRYWLRYCPWALQFGDMEHLARTHNGGPGWGRAFKTGRYWRKTSTELDGQEKRRRGRWANADGSDGDSGGGQRRRRPSAVVREPFPTHHAQRASAASGTVEVTDDGGVGGIAMAAAGAQGLAQIPFSSLNPDWRLHVPLHKPKSGGVASEGQGGDDADSVSA